MTKPDTHTNSILDSAKAVLTTEAQGLLTQANVLDRAFVDAVCILEKIKGRVIISGMGKSGHIGTKIAATFSSTGTPAHFVHPAECSHGDLGMITRDDAVVALSNSGNTAELGDLIAFTKRHSIPLIAITGNATSKLALAANAVLLLASTREACPMGLAPTTSSTLTLALGDALAVSLLERKGFTSNSFQELHPGGSLGQLLTRVGELMHSGIHLPVVDDKADMKTILSEMSSKRLGCVGVVDKNQKLIGIITDGDLRRHMNARIMDCCATDVMTAQPRHIKENTLAAQALGILNNRGITSLFVTDDDARPIGLVHIHDCLKAGFR